ncbi:MAG: extracellular solute-binding protein [Spiroplasma sp.]|nr:extracellular solute-binding protein [Spiroplasma sp.]
MKKFFRSSYLGLIFLFLYLPIAVLIIFSFNSGSSVRNFKGWGIDAYAELFKETSLWESFSVTLIVALISTIIAVIIGTFAALGLSRTSKLTRNMTLTITNIPLVNADIVTAVSLMLLFMAFAFNFGIVTLILAHISFNIPYVIITVLPKVKTISKEQIEASQDLGASSWYTLRKVVFPTLKPAIIAGAAIAFAMSFDDFIISYFTGGSTANLSTYIYSLKRIKPYINAFSTLLIVVIAFVIVGWNGYKIVKKQVTLRNERIINQTYRDKRINRLEKNLNKNYLLLNNVKEVKNTKRKTKKQILFHPISEAEEFYYVKFFENKIEKNKKITKKILKLEAQLDKEQHWVYDIKKKIIRHKKTKERASRIRREKFHFLRWPWKLILISGLVVAVFAGSLAFYIKSSTYDLSVANWGEYISPEILKDFEEEFNVKVKYTTYEDNETLYAKLSTTDYDIMVPSDYMVAQLASEDRLELLDLEKLKNLGINDTLTAMLENYQFEMINGPDKGQTKKLSQFAIPYFWGDLVLVFNTVANPNLLSDLGIDQLDHVNWDILQKAAELKKKIVLNNDMHNLFMLGLVSLHYQNQWGENTGTNVDPKEKNQQEGNKFTNYVNAHSNQEIDDVAEWLKPIIHNPNTKIQSDEIIDTVAIPQGWDIAYMYNGDLLAAMRQDFEQTNYQIARPFQGNNNWNDDMVISKNSQNKDLAYEFIKYIMRKNVQVDLSTEFGYTSPVQTAIDEVSDLYPEFNWKQAYIPGNTQIAPIDNSIATKGYYNGLYTRTFDPYMQDQYNKLLAGQGESSSLTSLIVQLVFVLLIVIGFIVVMLLIR